MAQDYNNIPAGLRLSTQIPLDVKSYIADEATLAYLGTANNLAYTYVDGMIIYCIAEKTKYVWREVEAGEENTGLVPLDFTYPANSITFGINYSSKKYNFFPATTGAAILNDLNDVTIASLANNNLLAYNSTTSQWENETYASLGLQTVITNPVTGYGTANKVPKYLNTSGGLVNSNITDTGALVTVASPTNIVGATNITGATQINGTTATDIALGSELLSTGGWTSAGWGGDFTLGFTHSTGNTSVLSNTLQAVIGYYYQITYSVTGYVGGTATISFGGRSVVIAGNGTNLTFGPTAISTANLTITPTTSFDARIFISIKRINITSPLITIRNSQNNEQFPVEIRIPDGDSRSIFIGGSSGQRMTTGINNTSIGSLNGASLTTGSNNTFLGYISGGAVTTGISNTFIGSAAGIVATGSWNTMIGSTAGYNTTTATNNVYLGYNTGNKNVTGSYNTFIGTGAGAQNGEGGVGAENNTALGYISGKTLTSGSQNLFLGSDSGNVLNDGTTALLVANNSIFIGTNTKGGSADNQTNQIVIGYNAEGLGSNTVVLGHSTITLTSLRGQIGIGTNAPVATAKVQVDSTTQGFLPPRMTTAQKNAISSPAAGLVIYDTDLNKLCVRAASAWQTITSV